MTQQHGSSDRADSPRPRRGGGRGLFVLIVLGSLALAMIQVADRRQAQPNTEQQVVATLTSWGLSLDGIESPVDPAEVDKQLALLRSPISETRVQAADWLASHGIRSSGDAIARAMNDPGTRRPCQLAKSLGSLGDDRWADKLILATQQRNNVDLQVCATLALGELQSPRAIQALIDVYRDDVTPPLALEALGRIADPAALPFLESVAASPRNAGERTLAIQAIERTRVMQRPDPAAALIDRLRRQDRDGKIKQWTVRKLAALADPRAVPALGDAWRHSQPHEARVWLTASLLAHGEAGRSVLIAFRKP